MSDNSKIFISDVLDGYTVDAIDKYLEYIETVELKNQINNERIRIKQNHNYDNDKESPFYNELEKVFDLFNNIDKLILLIEVTECDYDSYPINIDILKEKSVEKSEINYKYIDLLAGLPRFLTVDIKNEKSISYENLSSGEKSLLDFIYSVIDIIKKRVGKTDTIFIIVDEAESFMHPRWQKEVINYLIYFLHKFYKEEINVHIILASHSPFLLSDIPSSNVIFLDKDKSTGDCIVVDGLENKKETFGANIHTLLSDAFFMDGGLTGEYAKSKINELINYLNGESTDHNLNIETAQKWIDLIGEPVIKHQLQNMLNKIKPNDLDEINKQIEELTRKRDELEGKNE